MRLQGVDRSWLLTHRLACSPVPEPPMWWRAQTSVTGSFVAWPWKYILTLKFPPGWMMALTTTFSEVWRETWICTGSPEKLGTAVILNYSGNKLPNTLWLFLSFFETKSIVSQAGPQLATQLRMTLNFCSSYFYPSNAGVMGMWHIPIYVVLGMEPRASCKKIKINSKT